MRYGAQPSRSRPTIAVAIIAVGAVMAMSGTALAAVPLVQLSADPYTNTSSFHRTQVEPDTYAFGSTIVGVFQSGRFQDGGASNIGWATSTDSGVDWTQGFLPGTTVYATPPGTWARISDPSAAYDARHGVWLVNSLAINASVVGKAVLVNRSVDGGFTWGNPVTVSRGSSAAFYDKNWITCDNHPASPFYGNCYVQWDNANNGNALRMSRSTDGGLTWSNSSVPSNGVIGGQPLVQPNGRVVVPISNAFGTRLRSYVSTDGGASYSGPFAVSSIQTHPVAAGLRDGAGLSSAETDGAGRIYVVWHDCRFRSGCAANDLVMSTSTDGQSWSPVKRIPIVSTSSTVDTFIPGLGVDPATAGATGHLGLAFYVYPQASCTVSTCQLTAGFVSSADGGAHWSAPTVVLGPLTLGWLPLTSQGYMVGDYISTSISGGMAFPVLADATTGACQLGQVTSCHEFAVAPSPGLPLTGGSRAAETPPVLGAESSQQGAAMRTAF
jgi:hypothetical protein